MNLPPPLQARLDSYLHAVDRALAEKPVALRREILAGLREQALDALGHAGTEPSLEALERILAEMDPPESFADEYDAPAAAGTAAPRRTGTRWFLLALAFLAVNGYGVWRWTQSLPPCDPPAAPPTTPELLPSTPTPPATEALALLAVEQVNFTAHREATLRLVFNHAPNLSLLPQFLQLSTTRGSVGYRVHPASAEVVLLETDRVDANQLVCTLRPNLPSASAAGPTPQEYRHTLSLRATLLLKRLEAFSPSFEASSLLAHFTILPEPNGLERFVRIEPAVHFSAEVVSDWRGNGLQLHGDFKPGSVYSVTFLGGLPASNGSTLLEPATLLVQVPDRSPALQWDVQGRYLAPAGRLSIPVSLVNVDTWTVSAQRVFANNLVHFALRESGRSPYYGPATLDLAGPAVTQTNRVAGARNETVRQFVHLRDLAGEQPHGVYHVELAAEKAGARSQLIVVTDLGIAARVHEGGLLVWVNSLERAEPAAAARVTVFARNNQAIAEGETDAQGLCRLRLAGDEEPFLITAQLGGDLSFIHLDRSRIALGPESGGPRYLRPGAHEAAVHTDRGVYRPGETVFMQALVRDAKLDAPAPFPALFRVRQPDGRVYKDLPILLDARGSAHATLELPAFLPTGRYTVECALPGTHTVLGETTLALEDFAPPQIRVVLEAAPARQAAGQPVVFESFGEHLFGRAAAGLRADGHITFKPVPFAPPQWKGWRFGDDDKAFSRIFRNLGSQILDENGRAQFEAETSDAWSPPAALEAVQQTTVFEASGRAVTAYGSTPIDAYPFYIGLRPDREGALRVGETQRVAVVRVRPDGAPAPGEQALSVTLARVSWTSILRENSRGHYEWVSQRSLATVREDTLIADEQSRDWVFSVDRAGEYSLLVRDAASGSSTRLSFYAASAGQEWIEWSREKPGRIELQWDRERYRPGDVARLAVKAPFAGSALLTLESDRIHSVRVLTLEQNTAELEIPVEADFTPNVYCTLSVIRPAKAETVWSPHRAAGSIALAVEPPGRRLAVQLDAPETSRPQQPLATTITVVEEDGRPARGAVTLMAVDEAICMLTQHKTPDPNAVFLHPRRLGVHTHDLYQELMPIAEAQADSASAPGGDSASGLSRRLNPIQGRRFKPVALWQADVALDDQGRAEVVLPIPEFAGELRLMAVAVNARQAGSGEARVRIRRDLVAQPILPRFLALGDRCQAGLVLHNQSGEAREALLRVTVGGPLQSEVGEQRIAIPAGESLTVPLPLSAGPGVGKAICRIELEAGPDSYAETIELPVRPAAGLQVRSVSGVLAAGEEVALAPPADWLPGTLSQTGSASGRPALRLARALDYVMSYPYGCLEQTVSGALPLLYADELLAARAPGAVAHGNPAHTIQTALLRVLSMQQSSGGFSLWPFERGFDVQASLYATHFLIEAQSAGHAVPTDRLDAALGWLRQRLDQPTESDASSGTWATDMEQRAYACHLLALAGKPDANWNARLRELSARLTYAAQVHSASALLLAGEPRQAVPLLASLGTPQLRPRTVGDWTSSDVRDAALLLAAWVQVDPSHESIPRLLQHLDQRRRDDHWGTTQDNALALMAYGKYLRRVPAQETKFAGLLRSADGAEQAFSDAEPAAWNQPMGEAAALTLINRGPAPLYYASRFEGVGREAEPAGDAGVRLRRSFFDGEGQAIDPTWLARGDLIVVRLEVDTLGRPLDQLVIEELLPAGWEIENPRLATSQQFPWIAQRPDGARFRDRRDDRLLVFTGALHGKLTFHYAARAVTPGAYRYPPATVSAMYDPDIRSVTEALNVEVVE